MNGSVPHAWLRRVSDYCSGGVSATERATVEAHLASCAECRETLVMYRRFDALVRSPLRLGGGAVGVLPGYRPAIQEETMITNDSDQETATRTRTRTMRPQRRRAAVGSMAAIAAVVLVALLAGVLFALHRPPSRQAVPRPTPTPTLDAQTRAYVSVLHTYYPRWRRWMRRNSPSAPLHPS